LEVIGVDVCDVCVYLELNDVAAFVSVNSAKVLFNRFLAFGAPGDLREVRVSRATSTEVPHGTYIVDIRECIPDERS
jgi:hypothetical protein